MKNTLYITMLLIFGHWGTGYTQVELGRRANWEARFTSTGSVGKVLTEITKGSPMADSELTVGDKIIAVNDVLIDSDENWTEINYSLRANQPTNIKYIRNGKKGATSIKLNPYPKENHEGVDTYYESIVNDKGHQQRVIITKPNDGKKVKPAVIVLGGLSCSSIEQLPGRTNNWLRVLTDWVEKSKMVVMRVEKTGVGDSEGNCSTTDFHTDISGFRAAAALLKSKGYVDTTKIVVFGSSMGSALAPLIANEFNFAGVISEGTFFKTWFEHMLEIERRLQQMQGKSESEIVQLMNHYYIPLYYGMLVQKKTYGEVVSEYPALADYNYHASAHMYGRPVAYYHQLQDFDLAGEWSKVTVPVRILRGTNDWIMSDEDNDLIVEVVKRSGNNDIELYRYEGLDHWNTIHPSPNNSFEGKPGKWQDDISDLTIRWAQEIVNPD